jgi:hypothetical protein
MRGRIATQHWAATDWLESILVEGPAAVKYLKQSAYVGWRTVVKVKKELGVKSIHTQNGWIWYMPSINPELAEPNAIMPTVQGLMAEGEELEEDAPTDTARMVAVARHMHLTRLDSEGKILKQLIADCQQYPKNPPYTLEHIKAVRDHVVYGKPLPNEPV